MGGEAFVEQELPLAGKVGDNVISIDKAECTQFVRRTMSECCQKENIQKRIPILQWLPEYSWNYLVKDLIAGLTVGLTAIPQGIAYAVVAGLQPQYGLYSGFVGCFVYMVFGSCKDITIGPTAIMALMTQSHVKENGPEYAILLTFLSGIVIFLLGIFRLGFLVEFISMPVTVGFTSAAAITIASAQLKGLFGLPGKSNTFIESWSNLFVHFLDLRCWDTVLGITTIIILVLLKKLKTWSETCEGESVSRMTLKRSCWLVGLARNAVVVLLGSLLAYGLTLRQGYDPLSPPFLLTGPVTSGLPPLQPPPFSVVTPSNTTIGFLGMVQDLGSAILVVPLIGILESISIAKAFAKGKSIDATQELIALGLCNIAGSFVSSFPTTGSFTRTAVNYASGVVTPAGGIFTGVLVVLSLSWLTAAFYYIPKSTLAGVIITAMFYMVEYRAFTLLWRTKKADLVPLLTTLLACLGLGLEYGMIVGISVNLLFILYNSARPSVTLQWVWVGDTEVLLVTPTQSLVFPASDYFREVIVNTCSVRATNPTVVIDGTHIQYIDSTIAKGLKMVVDDLSVRKQTVIFWRWKESAMFTLLGFDPALSAYFKFEDSLPLLIQGRVKREIGDGQGEYEKVATSEESQYV